MTSEMNLSQLAQKSPLWTPNPPASEVDIDRAEQELNIKFASSYRKFLLVTDGGYGEVPVQPGIIQCYCSSELAEMNRNYHLAEHLPGYFMFGTSGGGEAFVIQLSNAAWPVYIVPWIPLQEEYRIQLSASFEDFLELIGAGEWEAESDAQMRPADVSGLPAEMSERTYVVDIDSLSVSDLDQVVLFYLPRWSGQANSALLLLCAELIRLNAVDVVIFCIDSDSVDADAKKMEKAVSLFGDTMHGYGEACWVRNGNIIGRDVISVVRPSRKRDEREQQELEKRDLIASRIQQLMEGH